jgi:protein-disulfide isomerase
MRALSSVFFALCLGLLLLGHAPPTLAATGGANPLPISSLDASWGDDDAPVTLVVFADLQCPFCKRLHGTLVELQRDYGARRLRVVFKHHPLPFHKQATPAAEIAVAVHRLKGNAGFWEYAELAFEELVGSHAQRDPWAPLADMGVSERSVKRLIDSGAPLRKVESDTELAKKVGARGTPTSFINGIRLSGAQPKPKFAELIDSQLKAASELGRRGVARGKRSARLTRKNYEPYQPPKRTAPKASPRHDSKTRWKVPMAESPVRGRRDALVTLVVFSDFQCPYCSRLTGTIAELERKYGRDLRVVFKHHPLAFHRRAEPAAHFSIEAHKRLGMKGFWRAHDALFASQKALTDSDLERIARDIGLSPAQALRAVRDKSHQRRLDRDKELVDKLRITGTPASFINGRRLTGARPAADFEAIIDEELKHTRAMVARGTPRSRIYAALMRTAKAVTPKP